MDVSPHESLFGSLSGTMDLSPTSFEDDVDDLGNMSDGDSPEQLDSSVGPKRKSRRLPSTAEKRATHNAVERARRESLNGRFMELARILPSMSVNKRPSKNAIVSNSLEFVKTARAREQALESENARLRKEVNELRAKLGMPAVDLSAVSSTVTAPAPITKANKNKPAQEKTQTKVKVQPAPLVMPTIARTNSAPVMTATAPYLTPDALFGFMEPVSTKKVASSPSDSTSDTESSIVTTPASSYGFDGASLSPLFFEDQSPVSAVNSALFEHDLLAACGIQSSFPTGTATIPTWPAAANMGMSFAGAPNFALYA